jgi:hypothetical protein
VSGHALGRCRPLPHTVRRIAGGAYETVDGRYRIDQTRPGGPWVIRRPGALLDDYEGRTLGECLDWLVSR